MHRNYMSIIQKCLPTVKQTKWNLAGREKSRWMFNFWGGGTGEFICIFFWQLHWTGESILLYDINPLNFKTVLKVSIAVLNRKQTALRLFRSSLSRFWHARCLATLMTMFVPLVSVSVANCDCSVYLPLTSRNIGHLHVIQTKTFPFFREFLCTCYA